MKHGIGAGTFSDARFPASGSQLINCHAYLRPQAADGEENPYYVKGAAGLDLVVNLDASDTSGCGGMYTLKGVMYAVVGSTLYKDVLGTPTPLGTIGGTGLCTISVGRVSAVIQRGDFLYNATDTALTAFTLPDATEKVASVAELDSFTVYSVTDSDKMYSSLALDPTNIDSLAFATAETRADEVRRLLVARQTIWAMGSRTIELFYNAGQDGFPFARYSNAMIETGLLAKHSAAQFQDNVFFIGTDSNIYLGKDINAAPVSQPWLDEVLGITDLAEAYTVAYVANGVVFFAVTVPGVGTYELNSKTGQWSNRTSIVGGADAGQWRAKGFVHFEGRSYVGDFQSGKIYRVNADSPLEDGEQMQFTLGMAPLPSREHRSILNYVDVDFNPGTGAGGTLTLDYSDDDGRTYKGERTMTAVAGRRNMARQLGLYRRRQLRLKYQGTSQFRVDNVWVGGVDGW